jgi:hypothetical protein
MSSKQKLFWAFTFALGLALVGVCGWGLASSIDLTDTTVRCAVHGSTRAAAQSCLGEAAGRVAASLHGLLQP